MLRRLQFHDKIGTAFIDFYCDVLGGQIVKEDNEKDIFRLGRLLYFVSLRGSRLAFALNDIFTSTNFIIAAVSALIGYVVFENKCRFLVRMELCIFGKTSAIFNQELGP
jgi:hypothetical protein